MVLNGLELPYALFVERTHARTDNDTPWVLKRSEKRDDDNVDTVIPFLNTRQYICIKHTAQDILNSL